MGTEVGSLTWSVDNEQSWQLEAKVPALSDGLCAHFDGVPRNIGRSDLLRDSTCLPFLHTCTPDVVQQLCLPCMAINA